jgi:hypothetical protein
MTDVRIGCVRQLHPIVTGIVLTLQRLRELTFERPGKRYANTRGSNFLEPVFMSDNMLYRLLNRIEGDVGDSGFSHSLLR